VSKEDALVCEGFARLGYCEAGADCPNLHVFECPDYSNKGNCDVKPRCYLPHVKRAGQLRRLNGARNSADPSSNDHSEAERSAEPEPKDARVGFYEDVTGEVTASANDDGDTSFQEQDDFIRL
jgi:hypothetical protein